MTKRKIALLAFGGFVSVAAASCAFLLSAPTPMRAVNKPVDAAHPTRCLVVFLPGMGDDEKVFIEHGFVNALNERKIQVDTISAGATIGYYAKRTIIDRLSEDILRPAQARGYQQTWLVGVSMGGIGSLLVAKKDPSISGILLLAPYLGEKEVLEEIEHAGGLESWQPGAIGKDDYQRDVWSWLKGSVKKVEERPLYLGAGEKDHLSRGHRILAAALPQDHVYRTPGGHDWGPWNALWADFLDHSEFAQRCSAEAKPETKSAERAKDGGD